MRCMVIIKADKQSEAGIMDPKVLEDMTRYNDELVNSGVMLGGEGLHPSSKAKRVRFSKGKTQVIDGPFAETKELVAGYWIWKVASMDEAIQWVKKCPVSDTEIEIRPLFELDDFGPELTPELREREERQREKIESRK